MRIGVPAKEIAQLRADLVRIGNETIFSSQIFDDDAFVGRHIVKTGETLGKIAKQFQITADLLVRINHIKNKNVIRVGQTLKVVQGPFRAEISKGRFRMDVYLDNTFVKSFPVGTGAQDSTPTGEWVVKDKLVNPTYYPARGGNIIAADDPANPLGERWIALKGVSGEAVGQQRYGIHGTIDPNSIGKNVSLGCIRLHNADVEFLYDLLIVGKSKVMITS